MIMASRLPNPEGGKYVVAMEVTSDLLAENI